MDENEQKRKSELLYDIVVDTTLIISTGIMLVMLIDSASDGAASRQIANALRSKVIEPGQRWLQFSRDRNRVLNHATWITIEGANDR